MKVNRNITYSLDNYHFKNFIILDDNEKKMIWNWRNDNKISKWMINQDFIPLKNHLHFISNLPGRSDKLYWLVYKKNKPVGVVNTISINWETMSGFFGIYLNPEFVDSGEGLSFSYYCRSFYYNILNFKLITGEILVGNTKAFLFSRFFRVKPVGIIEKQGQKYIKMLGRKEDFNQLENKNLIRQFVKFANSERVNWTEIVEKFE